ncbi:MAG: (2Fe-2S)-binding protein [Deltaproteobacteria bacterium]|jgi:bacterioferritin-associated ferredoxin|nr:(2Fe-2S)-binding protein [Deltaproteobacteria bacterium]
MDPEELKKNWLLQNEKICICKGIPRKFFSEAIRKGASSLAEVNTIVGSGSGDCKGERCGPKIEELLAEYHAKNNRKSG